MGTDGRIGLPDVSRPRSSEKKGSSGPGRGVHSGGQLPLEHTVRLPCRSQVAVSEGAWKGVNMEATPRGSWWGGVLFVDVGTGETREEALDWEAARDFIGGRGLAAFYLFKHLVPGTDPLSPENPLIFAGGPLSGTSCPGSARGAVATKSPQSGIYTFGITGGELGPALKRSGYDVIIITGKAENPVYVEVGPGGAKLRSASHLWGLDTQLTQE